MILGDHTSDHAPPAPSARWPTLDDLFRSAVKRRGDAAALIDPRNRPNFVDGPPKRLSFADADCIVSAIAERLRAFGLPVDSVVALHLPNSVESVLTLLGIWRAGMIAAPLPVLWRGAEAVQALAQSGARALITFNRIDATDYGEIASRIAADVFSVRCVAAFGAEPPDGVEGLDDVFTSPHVEAATPARTGDPARHVAVVTFDMTEAGFVPVARSHAELIAGGLAIALEARVRPESDLLGAVAISSFAGLATTAVLWLISGGSLTLHQPFDLNVLAGQCSGTRCDTVVLPGPTIARLSDAGLLGAVAGQKTIGVWRAPERRTAGGSWAAASEVIDVLAFGEVGVVPLRRNIPGEPAPLTERALALPISQEGPPILIEAARIAGALALGGAMVPRLPFPPGAAMGLNAMPTGFVETGYACRVDSDGALVLDGPPAGIVNVGGYRFRVRELNDVIPQVGVDGTLAILPDSLTGYRLAGVAADRDAIREALMAQGANSLIVSAFGQGRNENASAA